MIHAQTISKNIKRILVAALFSALVVGKVIFVAPASAECPSTEHWDQCCSDSDCGTDHACDFRSSGNRCVKVIPVRPPKKKPKKKPEKKPKKDVRAIGADAAIHGAVALSIPANKRVGCKSKSAYAIFLKRVIQETRDRLEKEVSPAVGGWPVSSPAVIGNGGLLASAVRVKTRG